MNPVVLEARGISKAFPGVVALDDVSISVRFGEIVGLVGENGAGKTTLLKVLAGLVMPDSGTIALSGSPLVDRGVAAARRAGIALVHQELSLIPTISVAENILLGAEGGGRRFGLYRWARMHDLARRHLDRLDSRIDPAARTSDLPFAERQIVELAKALVVAGNASGGHVLLLDEPTSMLDADGIEALFAQLDRLRATASIVFVSHRLDEVLSISDRVYVMRGGRVVGERAAAEVQAPELYELMVGPNGRRPATSADPAVLPAEPRVRLELEGVSRRGLYEDVSFRVHAGEIVGLAGVQGSGREALCRSLFGAEPVDAGRVMLDGAVLTLRSPRDAVQAGIAYLPAERRADGILPGMSVAENITLAHLRMVCAGPVIRRAHERALGLGWIERLRMRAVTPSTPVETLSGGTQQKVLFARWMCGPELRLLVLDHPTRGMDVGAKAEVDGIIRGVAATGVAVILMADTLDETINLSDRIVVMKDGRCRAVFPAPPDGKPSQVQIVEAMV